MFLSLNKIKKNSLRIFVKKTLIFLYQRSRVYFYKTISLNKADLDFCKINQPVYFMGLGRIVAKKVNFGVLCSPFFLNGYSYIEARSVGSCIKIGENTFINNNAVIIADRTNISIGSFCLIGTNFTVFDSDFHGINPEDRLNGHYKTADVVIYDNVFIGNNVTITKGVTIGKNAVIGTGTVVTKDVPANTIYAGNPAKCVRDFLPTTQKNVV